MLATDPRRRGTFMDFAEKQPTPACHVVAMPYPGRGHINPMLNLCKVVAEKSSDILITFVVTEEWLGFIGSISKPPNFSFAAIPNVVPSERVRVDDIFGFVTAVLTNMEEPFERLLDQIPLQPAVIIADAFMPWTAKVAGRRNVPLAYLWTMSASMYTLFYHFDLLVQNGHFPVHLSVNGNATVDYIPGLPPTRVADLPTSIIRNQEIISSFLKGFPDQSKAKYIIFTSIYELEAQTFDAFKQKVAFSIYNIGPATSFFKAKEIINSTTTCRSNENDTNYLNWLDLQPPNSVLYISLGSFLSVTSEQMNEIAAGVNKSGVRFFWVSRNETERLQQICGKKGLVLGWCDQLSVLCHPSVCGFWSHCGWNSTKEAVLAGVPLLTFPIVMDQFLNAKTIVEDWRIGWRVKREFNKENLAECDEIAELVQRFMNLESPERKELTRNARELQKICEREFADGQSFQTHLHEFTKSILQHSPCTL